MMPCGAVLGSARLVTQSSTPGILLPSLPQPCCLILAPVAPLCIHLEIVAAHALQSKHGTANLPRFHVLSRLVEFAC